MNQNDPDIFGVNYATKGYNTRPAKVKRIDILSNLIGRKVKMYVPGEGKADSRIITIKKSDIRR